MLVPWPTQEHPPATLCVAQRRGQSDAGRGATRRRRADTPELKAFFGCLYYAGLRPEEAVHLSDSEYERPATPGGWGWFNLSGATAEPGRGWSDTDDATEDRGLKHRAKATTRPILVAPPLAELLDWHIERYPPAANGRLFVTRRGLGAHLLTTPKGRPLRRNAISTAWRKARNRIALALGVRSPARRSDRGQSRGRIGGGG